MIVSASTKCWALVPAAGVGTRMAAHCPKQYLLLQDKTILAHSVLRLCQHPLINQVVVVISPDDAYWTETKKQLPSDNVVEVCGGKERCHSVFNGLKHIVSQASDNDWVLVHDAARPCVRVKDIDALIAQATQSPHGGLLGLPVSDTLKYCAQDHTVERTVARDHLWRALTPQLFPVQTLFSALEAALSNRQWVTDEASAMEMAGYRPLMVQGHADNIKVTYPQDLSLATQYLQWQQQLDESWGEN